MRAEYSWAPGGSSTRNLGTRETGWDFPDFCKSKLNPEVMTLKPEPHYVVDRLKLEDSQALRCAS